jgi:hemolysin activation/secretion protein
MFFMPRQIKLTALALLWPAIGLAQQAMPEATGATAHFPISGYELVGDIPLSTADTTRVLAPFIVPAGTLGTLQQATAALEAELKAKGYVLHRVVLPPQEVGAKVTLNVVKFVIGKITVEGSSRYSESNIRASVPELRQGESPNFKILAVQTTIANENQGKQIQVSLKESEEADKIDVRLLVKESSPWSVSANLANSGSEATGRDRLSLAASHANLFDLDHQLSVAYTTSLERISDVKQLGLNYRIPFYRLGGVLGLSYTNSDVVGNFGTFSSTGAGQTFGLSYSHYLSPNGGRRAFLSVNLDEKIFNANEINGISVPGQMDRGSRPLTVRYNAHTESDTSIWGYSAEVAFNLPGSKGNNLTAYQAEDPRIHTVNWRVLRGGANYLSSFGSGWLWSVRGQFQYSADALIAGEQFGLGGASSVRGTAERPISGDSGLVGTLELNTKELTPGLRLLAFVDAGWLASNHTDLNPNKASSDQLASTGVGLRYITGNLALSAEWGRVVTGAVQPPLGNTGLPQVGDKKLHVSLTAHF